MFSLNESNRFVLSLTSVNMRNGINGLCGLILYTGLVPTNGDVYIFINRNRTILKLLHFELYLKNKTTYMGCLLCKSSIEDKYQKRLKKQQE